MGLGEVSNILWRERQLLELLEFKLDEEQFVMSTGRSPWIKLASREVEVILDAIRSAELARAVAVTAVGELFGLGPEPSLGELMDRVDLPWRRVLEQHRVALLAVSRRIGAIDARSGGPERWDPEDVLVWLDAGFADPAASASAPGVVIQESLRQFLS